VAGFDLPGDTLVNAEPSFTRWSRAAAVGEWSLMAIFEKYWAGCLPWPTVRSRKSHQKPGTGRTLSFS